MFTFAVESRARRYEESTRGYEGRNSELRADSVRNGLFYDRPERRTVHDRHLE